MEVVTYTTILHQARQELKITTNEYCIADIIYHLSNNPKSKVQGWCYASRQAIGNFIGITKPSVLSIIERLEKKEIVEKDEETKYLRTTEKWFNTVVITRLKKLGKENIPAVKKTTDVVKKPTDKVKKTTASGKETLPYIYKDNNINNNKIIKDSVLAYSKQDKDLTDLLYEKVKRTYPKAVAKITKDHLERDYEEMNRINRIDKWTYEQIKYVINWSQEDGFWRKNIRSVKTLRKRFERLAVEIQTQKDKGQVVKI